MTSDEAKRLAGSRGGQATRALRRAGHVIPVGRWRVPEGGRLRDLLLRHIARAGDVGISPTLLRSSLGRLTRALGAAAIAAELEYLVDEDLVEAIERIPHSRRGPHQDRPGVFYRLTSRS